MSPDPVAPPTVRDYMRILGRRWWVVVIGIVGFTALLVAYSYHGPTIYKATSEVRFSSGDTTSVAVNAGNRSSAGSASQEVLTEVEVIKSPNFKNRIIDAMKLGKKSIKQVNVGNVLSTNAIKISIGMSTANQAVLVADQYASTYVHEAQLLQAQLTKGRTASTAAQLATVKRQVDGLTTAISTEAKRIDAADQSLVAAGKTPLRTSALLTSLESQLNQSLPGYTALQQQYFQILQANAAAQPTVALIADAQKPTTPSQPTPVKYGIIGAFLGIIFGIAGAFGFELLTDKVRSRQDVERFSRLPVLATVPRRGKRGDANRPVSLTAPASARAEAYRAARSGVQFLSMRAPMSRIVVAGLRAKDHQDVAAANLAVTLASAGARVVLVDVDLRGGQLHDRFGLTRGNGLTSVLLGDSTLAEVLRPVEVAGGALRVLSTGPLPPNPADLVASDSLAAVLSQLADGADFVVISAPPLLPFNDALALARHADGVIMVATARRTRRRQLADGSAKLRRIGAPTIGVILDGGTRGADTYESSIGSVQMGEVRGDDTPSAPATV
ncbi:MAG TPA: polysaccharide biosynthesis tyrosine autokinase [Acidimicrobiia bacterium]